MTPSTVRILAGSAQDSHWLADLLDPTPFDIPDEKETPMVQSHPMMLNIGTTVTAEAGRYQFDLPVAEVLHAMAQHGVVSLQHTVHYFGAEPTVIVDALVPSDAVVHELSEALHQDCIAVYDLMHREGRLIGPKAASWGEFDPARFMLLNGSRLSEARSVA